MLEPEEVVRSLTEDVRPPLISSPGVMDLLCCREVSISCPSQSRSSRLSVDDRIAACLLGDDDNNVGILLPEPEVGILDGGDTGSLEEDEVLEDRPGIRLGVEDDPMDPDLAE